MTQTENPHSYLTDEEDFPAGLDWNMDVEVREKERDPGHHLGIRNLEWEYALEQSFRFIQETFPELEGFHDSLDGQLNVGYSFDFMLGPEDEIAVISKIHPAIVDRNVNHIIYDEVMAEAYLVLKFKDRRTEGAVREYLREKIGQSPEEIPSWGNAQMEAASANRCTLHKAAGRPGGREGQTVRKRRARRGPGRTAPRHQPSAGEHPRAGARRNRESCGIHQSPHGEKPHPGERLSPRLGPDGNTPKTGEKNMSMKSAEYQYLTQDGKFPADLDWEIEIETTEHKQTGRVTIKDVDWEFVLFLGGPDILPMLVGKRDLLPENRRPPAGGLQVPTSGWTPDRNITARGNMYPAQITPGHSVVFTGEKPLVSADLVIKPKDPRTYAAVREYIELFAGTDAPETVNVH